MAKTKKVAKGGGKSSSGAESRWARFLPPAEVRATATRVLLAVLGIVAVGFGIWGSMRIRDEVRADDRFRLETWELAIDDLPDWVTPEIATQISELPEGITGRTSLFDRGVLLDLRAALESSPWIEKVVDVDLAYPTTSRAGEVRARLAIRQPVVMVAVNGDLYLTDAQGRRLGRAYEDTGPWRDSAARWFRVPIIRGSRDIREVPAEGERWTARDVVEGVGVARVIDAAGIHDEYPQWPIEAIDVANVGGRLEPDAGDIVLVCDGRQLVWGRSPLSRESRTLPVDEVIANLRFVLHNMHLANYKLVKLHYPRAVVDSG